MQQCTGATRHVREPLAGAEGKVAGLLHGPLARRARGNPANMHPAGAMSMNTSTYMRFYYPSTSTKSASAG